MKETLVISRTGQPPGWPYLRQNQDIGRVEHLRACYSRHPAMMKQRTDRFFAEGIITPCCTSYHAALRGEEPGRERLFGNEFDRKNTWFSQLIFTAT